MNYLNVGGIDLEILDIPATDSRMPPALLLHEGLGCVAMWRDFPQALATATGARVIAWSRAGYGHSGAADAARSADYLEREAQFALPALLAALSIPRPVLVGHSDGGSIALLYAACFPASPSGVVVMAPHEFVEEETLSGIRQARQAWAETDLPQKLGRYHRAPQRVFDEWSLTWLAEERRHWNMVGQLAGIACPVLAIQGIDDEYASLRQIDCIAERHADTRLLKLARCAHSPHRERQDEVVGAIDAFMRTLPLQTA